MNGYIGSFQADAENKNREAIRESKAHKLLVRSLCNGSLDGDTAMKTEAQEYIKSVQPLGEFEHTGEESIQEVAARM